MRCDAMGDGWFGWWVCDIFFPEREGGNGCARLGGRDGTRGVGVVWRCVWAVGCRVVAIGGPCLGAWGGWKDCRVPRLFILFFSVTAECRQMEVDDVKG